MQESYRNPNLLKRRNILLCLWNREKKSLLSYRVIVIDLTESPVVTAYYSGEH